MKDQSDLSTPKNRAGIDFAGGLNPYYVMDGQGKRIAVILPLDEFDELIQTLGDLAAVAECRDESTVSHADLLRALEEDGLI